MGLRIFFLLLTGAMAWAPAFAASAPPEALLASAATAAISPAGRSVALASDLDDRSLIIVKDFATRRAILRADLGAAKVRRVQWIGERHLLVLSGRGEQASASVLDVASRRLTRLMREAPGGGTIVDAPAVRSVRGAPIAYLQASLAPGRRFVSLVRVEPDPVAIRPVDAGQAATRGWVVGPDGEAVAQELYDERSRRWTLRVKGIDGWREVRSTVAGPDAARVLGLGRDGKAVMYATRAAGRRWLWREARLDGARPAEPLLVEAGAAPLHDPQDGRLIGYVVLERDEPRYIFFDPADAAAWKAVTGAFRGDRVRLASWSADRRRIVAVVDSADDEPAYAQVDLNARTADWLEPGSARAERGRRGRAASRPSRDPAS